MNISDAQLIGLAGLAGAGKTTIAKHLVEKYGFARTAFADPLKTMLINAGLCTYEECYVEKTQRSRELLQKIGTDIFRKQVDPLFWVNKTEDSIVRIWAEEKKRVVVDDIRFPEEAQRIRDMGGILIMVKRGDYVDPTAGSTHESERLVQLIECDHLFMANSRETDKILWQMDKVMESIRNSECGVRN
jgi:hypothetical protein